MERKHLGWVRPNTFQQIRALRGAHPEAGESILAGITADPTSDLSALTCNLDQGALGSCTANGIAQMMYVAQHVLGLSPFVLARLFLYYEERALEGTISQDAGANIGDGMRMIAAKGIPPESTYPYDIAKFAQDPGPEVDRLAYDSKGAIGVNYHPISSTGSALITDVEKALTAKMAVVFGCTVSEAFCSTIPSGTVQVPGPKDQVAGGHCMALVGHDRPNRRLLVKNSWSNSWRDPSSPPGCFYMSYDYFTDPEWGASDCWCVVALPKGITP
jgi:C1A family cysteine protease